MAGFNYTIQVSTYDCTGCELCAESCPDDALIMTPAGDVIENTDQTLHWDYSVSLPTKPNPQENPS